MGLFVMSCGNNKTETITVNLNESVQDINNSDRSKAKEGTIDSTKTNGEEAENSTFPKCYMITEGIDLEDTTYISIMIDEQNNVSGKYKRIRQNNKSSAGEIMGIKSENNILVIYHCIMNGKDQLEDMEFYYEPARLVQRKDELMPTTEKDGTVRLVFKNAVQAKWSMPFDKINCNAFQ